VRISSKPLSVSFGALLLLAPPNAQAGELDASEGEGSSEGSAAVDSDPSPSPTGEFGPFFEEEPVSEVHFPTRPAREGQPLFGVGNGAFCFVEDSGCRSSLIADFDFGAGVNVVGSEFGVDIPMTQWRVRGGFTVRPMYLARDRWHRWGLGITAAFSQATPQVAVARTDSSDTLATVEETDPVRSTRIDIVNQLWMSQRRNAFHLDFSLGAVRSPVLNAGQFFWGTHAEIAMGWGGLAGFYASTDFLDRDLRAIFGFRTHAGIAGPIVGLIALGLLAGGAR
jgi:hypothetical protein